MPSLTYINRRKLKVNKKCANMRKAKARKRQATEAPEREPKMKAVWLYGWEITVKNKIDGASVKFEPVSIRDCVKKLTTIFRNYKPRGKQ